MPFRRVLYLTELARRGEAFPLSPERPAERPYHLVWRCLHGDTRSRRALEAVLFAKDTPAAFTEAAWTALLPDPGYRVFEFMIGEMTDREHLVSFAHLEPDERRRALEELDADALPPTLTDELLRELHGELWARILADPGDNERLQDHFLQSEYGFDLLRRQLASGHASNHAIARRLLLEHGLSLPFRTGGGLLLQLEARDEDAREQLAERWLEGELRFPARHVPQDALRRVLRRRGCSLR
jgi:hypothetical protein